MSIGTILVAVDFSPHSDAAIDKAIELGRAFDSKLHVVKRSISPAPS